MIGFRCQIPTCRRPQEMLRRRSPSAIAGPAPPASAGRDELSDLALMLGPARSGLDLHDAPDGRREDGEGDEGEEPGDVEIEPVREDELEADEDRRGESAELDHVLPPWHEVDTHGADQDYDLQRGLEPMQVGEARVLIPVPDRERRRAG